MIWMFKVVVDEVLVPQDFGPFVWIALAYVGLTLLAGVLGFADEYLATLDRRALPARPAHQVLRPPAGALARLLRSPAARRPDLAAHRRHRLDRGLRALGRDRRALLSCSASSSSAPRSSTCSGISRSVSLLVAPLFWLAARRFSRLIKVASREKRRRSGSISAVAEESLSNAALVQAYGQRGDRGRALPSREPGQLPRRDGVDAAEGALHAADRPDRAERARCS